MTESLIKHQRAASRLIALCCVTAGLYFSWLAVAPLALPWPDASRRWRALIFRAWARAVCRIAGMRVGVRGVPPRGAFLLVSNHLGYMDVVALASVSDCVFVAKSEVAGWPVLGHLCRSVNTIFVNRRRRRRPPARDRARGAGASARVGRRRLRRRDEHGRRFCSRRSGRRSSTLPRAKRCPSTSRRSATARPPGARPRERPSAGGAT